MAEEMEFINILDNKFYKKLKLAYAEAEKKHIKVFVVDGKELVTGYAKYLLEYLDDLRKKRKLKTFDEVKRKWVYPR